MSYNGHKNWTHWNVSLWMMNDEGLYHEVKRLVRRHRNKDDAAAAILESFHADNMRATPDGAVFSKTAIRAALVGFE